MQIAAHRPLVHHRPAHRIPRPRAPRHPDPLHGLDTSVESALGVDLRLLYGMLVPVLLIVGLIIALVLVRSYWLVAAALVPEIACLGLIVVKTMAMIDEPDQMETQTEPRAEAQVKR